MYKYSKYLSSLLLISTLIGGQRIYAQSGMEADESKNFVLFYSDSILYAENVRLRSDLFNDLVVRADSRRIPLSKIKFINTDEGFFASMYRLPGLGKELLAERVIEGRVNIFAERTYQHWGYDGRYRYHRRHRNRDHSVNMRMYFNKGYEPLKKVNYQNLSLAMADDRQSIDLLQGYRMSAKASKVMYIGAGLAIGASIVSFLTTASRDRPAFDMRNGFSHEPRMPNFTASYMMLGAGAGLALGGYAIHFSGLKKLEAAVDHYNR